MVYYTKWFHEINRDLSDPQGLKVFRAGAVARAV